MNTKHKTGATKLKYSLEKYKPYMELIKSASPRLRKTLINQADPNFIKAVVEIVANTLHGNIPISKHDKKILSKHKTYLRTVYKQCCSKKTPIKVKQKEARKILNQKGGFAFAFLIPLIAKAALGGAVAATSGYVTKKIIGG